MADLAIPLGVPLDDTDYSPGWYRECAVVDELAETGLIFPERLTDEWYFRWEYDEHQRRKARQAARWAR